MLKLAERLVFYCKKADLKRLVFLFLLKAIQEHKKIIKKIKKDDKKR